MSFWTGGTAGAGGLQTLFAWTPTAAMCAQLTPYRDGSDRKPLTTGATRPRFIDWGRAAPG